MERSDSVAKVAAALVGAQGELENVAKDAENPHFRNRYASLPAILDAVRPVLAKHGLAVIQFPTNTDDGRVGVETTILHASGEYLTHDFAVRLTKDDAQGAGSALTYCRRYSLAAVLAIGQDDDDGNAAAEPQRAPAKRAAPTPKAAPLPEHATNENAGEPPWIDDALGFGTHSGHTWRHMAAGGVDGKRHDWTRWLLSSMAEKERAGEKPTPAGQARRAKVEWVRAQIEKGIPF